MGPRHQQCLYSSLCDSDVEPELRALLWKVSQVPGHLPWEMSLVQEEATSGAVLVDDDTGTEALKILCGVVPQKHLCVLVNSQEGLNMFTLPSPSPAAPTVPPFQRNHRNE